MRTKHIAFGLVAALLPGFAGSQASAAVVFNSLSMTTSTYATAQRGASVDTHSTPISTTQNTLPVAPVAITSSTSAVIRTSGVNRVQSNATGTASALLFGPEAGSFDITTVNSIVQSLASTSAQPVSGLARAGDYSIAYAFTIIGPKTFTLDYSLFDPNFVGPGPLVAALAGPVGGFANNLTRNSNGSIGSVLASGNYLLTLTSGFQTQVSRAGMAAGTTTGGSFDHFDFSIAGVPEPSAWALMIVGFGLTGFAMRRRGRPSARSMQFDLR